MRVLPLLLFCFLVQELKAQELYVFTDPASSLPAHAISLKLAAAYMPPQVWNNRLMQRYTPEFNIGISPRFMLRTGTSVANVNTSALKWESVYLYGKYRFFSRDELHTHFRLAVFAEGSYTKSPFHNEEVNLLGDKNGVQLGVVATQLWNRFALSGTVTHTQVLDKSRGSKAVFIPTRIYQAMNYSLSGGYLVLPKEYNSYKQTNLNLYAEVLAQQTLDRSRYYIDLAPAAQLIFNSSTKINLGYRFQVAGNMIRMAESSWLFGIERTFLGVWKKKSK